MVELTCVLWCFYVTFAHFFDAQCLESEVALAVPVLLLFHLILIMD